MEIPVSTIIVSLLAFLLAILAGVGRRMPREKLASLLGIQPSETPENPSPELRKAYRDRLSSMAKELNAERRQKLEALKTAKQSEVAELQRRLNKIEEQVSDIEYVLDSYRLHTN